MKKQTPETAIKKEIKDWLTIEGWFHFPILQGLGAYKGICDRVAIKHGIILFIEIKAEHGVMSENQMIFAKNIKEAGGHYVLARGYKDVQNYIKDQLVQL